MILIMCTIYAFGTIIYSLSSVTPLMTSLQLAQGVGIGGALILVLSSGLMKAVYSSLGPEQFTLPEQRDLQKRFV